MKLRKIKLKKMPERDKKFSQVSVTLITEKKLQAIQKDFFDILQGCGKNCHSCKERPCDSLYRNFVKVLTPYATSIYKKNYKHRSTLDEMSRVITESINSLLIDIWHKGKIIHKSFGSMVKWKMLHYLDGKINLFDKDMFTSIDQYSSLMGDNNKNSNSGGEDVIDYYSKYLNSEYMDMDNNKDLLKGDLINTIVGLINTSKLMYSRYMCNKLKMKIEIKVLYGVLRFFQHKDNFILFHDDPIAKYYYTRVIDMVFDYLQKYKTNNCEGFQ